MRQEMAMAEADMRDMGLSKREREVTWLILEGMDNQRIAAFLGIREKTVKTHVNSIARKLDIPGPRVRPRIVARYLEAIRR